VAPFNYLIAHGVIAHGGVAGAVVEVSLALLIVAIALAVWIAERKGKE
jgi:hypothetical protein